MGKPSPNYTDGGEGGSSSSSSSSSASPSAKRAKAASPAARKAAAAAASSSSSSPSPSSAAASASAAAAAAASSSSPPNPRSIRNLNADLDHLDANFLGKIIPPMGGQVKRAVMEEACAEGSPSFSRMSGIQEWRNAVFLFVNIYGEVRERKGTEREAVCVSVSGEVCVSTGVYLCVADSCPSTLSSTGVQECVPGGRQVYHLVRTEPAVGGTMCACCVRACCVCACLCVLCVRAVCACASCVVHRASCVCACCLVHPSYTPHPPLLFLTRVHPTHCQNPFLNPFQGTPVVQRLINCAGGKNADGKTVKATPVRQRIVKCSVWRNIYTEK